MIEDSLTSYEKKFKPLDVAKNEIAQNEKPLSKKGSPIHKGEEIMSDDEEDEMYFGIKSAQEESKKIEKDH